LVKISLWLFLFIIYHLFLIWCIFGNISTCRTMSLTILNLNILLLTLLRFQSSSILLRLLLSLNLSFLNVFGGIITTTGINFWWFCIHLILSSFEYILLFFSSFIFLCIFSIIVFYILWWLLETASLIWIIIFKWMFIPISI